MIVLDENIHARPLLETIASWYTGQVVSVTTLRPGSIIKDEAIPMLLLQLSQPTFVTINVTDFWKVTAPHQGYCITTVALPREQIYEVAPLVRNLLQLSMFNTKAQRMGKIIRLNWSRLEYYDSAKQVHSLDWSK